MSSASLESSSSSRIRREELIEPFECCPVVALDDCPKDAKFFGRVDKFVRINRLYHIGVHSQPIAPQDVFLLMGRRQHNHRHHLQALVGLDLP